MQLGMLRLERHLAWFEFGKLFRVSQPNSLIHTSDADNLCKNASPQPITILEHTHHLLHLNCHSLPNGRSRRLFPPQIAKPLICLGIWVYSGAGVSSSWGGLDYEISDLGLIRCVFVLTIYLVKLKKKIHLNWLVTVTVKRIWIEILNWKQIKLIGLNWNGQNLEN